MTGLWPSGVDVRMGWPRPASPRTEVCGLVLAVWLLRQNLHADASKALWISVKVVHVSALLVSHIGREEWVTGQESPGVVEESALPLASN